MLELRHFSWVCGGQAVRVRDLHRAGANEQQLRCIQGDVRDLELLHCCLYRRHGKCAVCYEDLAAEERMLCLM